MNIKEFLYRNKLKQVELADYLGVTEASISKLVKGISRPSKENLRKIIENPNGWDVSMLTGEGSIIAGNGNGGDSVVTIGARGGRPSAESTRVAVLEKENEMLRERLKDKEAQIEFLRELVRK